jgi:hypothetical protein
MTAPLQKRVKTAMQAALACKRASEQVAPNDDHQTVSLYLVF